MAAAGVGMASIRLVATAVGMRRAGFSTRAGTAATDRGAEPPMAFTAAAADFAGCAPAVALRSVPAADRRGDGVSAEFSDRDAESDWSAEAGAEVLRPMTIPAPSAAATPPTRPTKPAAVMARSIAGSEKGSKESRRPGRDWPVIAAPLRPRTGKQRSVDPGGAQCGEYHRCGDA